ncbi:MAG: hypothetical protein KDB03_16485 [Planctomycetales bacterium]|nr:hypothetical protein [Planctomycetales bacterium]
MRKSWKTVGVSLLSCLALFAAHLSGQDELPVAEAIATVEPTTPIARPLTVSVALLEGTTITGTLADSTALNIKTAFGEAQIPLSEVAGIRFPSGEDTSTTVVMLNGDSITGATDLKFVGVETTWGSAKINGPNITSMLFVPGLAWQSKDGLGGKRWALVEAAANQGATNAQPMVNSSPSRNSSIPTGPFVQPRPGTIIVQ